MSLRFWQEYSAEAGWEWQVTQRQGWESEGAGERGSKLSLKQRKQCGDAAAQGTDGMLGVTR